MNFINDLRNKSIFYLSEYRFNSKLRKTFNIKKIDGNSIILIEHYQLPASRLALSLFIPVLSNHLHAKPTILKMVEGRIAKKIIEYLKYKLIYSKIFGENRIIVLLAFNSMSYIKKAKKLLEDCKSPDQFLDLEYCGVKIGDLVYDSYLSEHTQYTLNLDDYKLVNMLARAMKYTDFAIEPHFERFHSSPSTFRIVGILKILARGNTYPQDTLNARITSGFVISIFGNEKNMWESVANFMDFKLGVYRTIAFLRLGSLKQLFFRENT